MKKLILAALALGIFAAVPASAQDIRVRAGPGGVTIRSDDDRGFRGRGPERRIIERRTYREGRRFRRDDCRVVTTRIQRPNGTVVVRRERRC